MMYMKTKTYGDKEAAELVLQCTQPRKMKVLGRQAAEGRDPSAWNVCKYDVVKAAVRAKFTQHPNLGEVLKCSYPKTIVEAAWYDNCWGVGFSQYGGARPIMRSETEFDAGPDEWTGQNLLGRVLMDVRDELLGRQ